MKKLIIASGLVVFVITIKAQSPQPLKPPGVEERLKRTNEVLQQVVQPETSQKTAMEQAFKIFFTAEDKLKKNNPPPPPPPTDAKVKEAMDKLVNERDESIKRILTEAQFQKYQLAVKKLQPPIPGDAGKGGPPPPQQ